MRRVRRVAPLVVAAVLMAPPATLPVASAGTGCEPGVSQNISVPDAAAPGGQRQVWIHRPAGPDSRAIPVVYFLHGYPGSAADAVGASWDQLLDHLQCVGHRPVVMVVPDGNVNGGLDTEWGDDARGRFALETFVTKTLPVAVEGGHRRQASRRALVGFSMGGYAAVTLALRHRIYGRVIGLAGYYKVDDPDDVFGTRAVSHDPAHLLAGTHTPRVLLIDAASDPDGLTQGEAARFVPLMRSRGVLASVRVRPGGHSLSFVTTALPSVMGWLDGGWPRG